MRIIKTPLKYPGGKSRAAETILGLIPPDFKEYREAFLGGGSIYFSVKQKYPDRNYWINDLNYELYNFWKMCQEDSESVSKSVLELKNKFSNGKELFYHLKRSLRELNDVELAGAYFILNKIAFSGCTLVGGFSEHAFNNSLTDSSLENLRKVKQVLEGTRITNLDYSKIIEAPPKNGVNNEDVFVFCDPPYYSATDSGLYGKGGGKWHNLHKTFDHYRFANIVKASKYKYLITYDDSPFVRKLFSFANIVSWDLIYSMKRHGTGKEIFISNFSTEKASTIQDNVYDAWLR